MTAFAISAGMAACDFKESAAARDATCKTCERGHCLTQKPHIKPAAKVSPAPVVLTISDASTFSGATISV